MLRSRCSSQPIKPEGREKRASGKEDSVEVQFLCEKFSGVLQQVRIEQQLRSDIERRRKTAAGIHRSSAAAWEAEVRSLGEQLADRERSLKAVETHCEEIKAEISEQSDRASLLEVPTSEETIAVEFQAEQEERERCAGSTQHLQQILAQARAEADSWQKRYLQQMQRVDELQEQLQKRQHGFGVAEDAVRCQQRELQQTLRRLAEERSQAEALGTQLQTAHKETRALGERLSAVRKEVGRRETALVSCQRDCQALECATAKFRADSVCAEEEAEASQLRAAWEEQIAQDEATLAQKEREFHHSAEAQREQWERQAHLLEGARLGTEAKEVELRSELQSLASELASVHQEDVLWLDREGTLNQELTNAKASCAELNAEIFALRPRLTAMKYEEASHARCLSTLQHRHAELLRIAEGSERDAKERRWRELKLAKRGKNCTPSRISKPRNSRQQATYPYGSPTVASVAWSPADSLDNLKPSEASSPSKSVPDEPGAAPGVLESPMGSLSSFGRTPSRALQYLQDFVTQEERRLHSTEGDETSFVLDLSGSLKEAGNHTLDISDTILSMQSDGKENCEPMSAYRLPFEGNKQPLMKTISPESQSDCGKNSGKHGASKCNALTQRDTNINLS